jgi:hypothetical protein
MNIEKQRQTQWCWAAVAVSIHNFLQTSPGTWTQETLATAVLQSKGVIKTTDNCSLTPGKCNKPTSLSAALTVTGNLQNALPDQIFSFDAIKNWLNARLPVPARIVWYGSGKGHFIVIDGIQVLQSGRQQVFVKDSDPNHYGTGLYDYDDLVDRYRNAGYWQDSYEVK